MTTELTSIQKPYRDDPNTDEDYHDAEGNQPPFDAEHSLPTPEELHTALAIVDSRLGRPPAKNQRRNLMLMLTGAVLVGAIVGFSVGMTNKKKASNAFAADSGVNAGNRYNSVVAFLSNFSPQYQLELENSPHNKAAKWIADVDQRQVPIPSSTSYQSSYQFLQRFILATMYYQLDGYNWQYSNMNFLSSTSECNWNFRLSVPMATPGSGQTDWIMGVACNEVGEINYMFMPNNNLRGNLPLEMKYLQGMEHLSLFNNQLTGFLPDIGDWSKLNFLALESNQFSGMLGDWFNFPLLEYLALGDNQFSGTLPDFSSFTKLREVAMDRNRFSGPVDVFNGATGLEILYLQENGFTGSIGDTTFANLKLKNLDLSDNFLTGTIPQHFFTYSIVDLHNNSLSGELPRISYAGYPIQFFSIFQNNLGGSIPESIGFLEGLTHLDLSENRFTGQIPADLNNLVNLQYLFMQHNNFEAGTMPSLWKLTNLLELSLRATNRTDYLYRWVGQSLTKLVLLDLSDNSFSGSIPEDWGAMSDMRFFFLSKNLINSTIPYTFSNMTNLTILLLDNNQITGTDAAVCGSNRDQSLSFFSGDCREFTCNCCTLCCTTGDQTCSALEMRTSFDNGYERNQYIFSEDLIFQASANFSMP